jgi:hypothetical protein
MQSIDDVMLQRLEYKGGENFKSLNITDIEYLFKLIDLRQFDGCVVKSLHGKKIHFSLKSTANAQLDQSTPGYVGTVGQQPGNIVYYFVYISPSIIARRALNENMSRLSVLISTMKQIIVHMIMILLGYVTKGGKIGFYQPNGPLFAEIYNKYFGNKPSVYYTNIFTDKGYTLGMFEWETNSCYLDSLLMILLNSDMTSYFLHHLIITEMPHKLILNISPETRLNYIIKLKNSLLMIYKELHTKTLVSSEPVRCMLLHEIPDLKNRAGAYTSYNVATVYSSIASAFPSLDFEVPYIIRRKNPGPDEQETEFITRKVSALTVLDYMQPYDGQGAEILWNQFNADILVLENSIPLKTYNSLNPESIVDPYTRTAVPITKVRKLDYEITLGTTKYTLMGVASVSHRGRYTGQLKSMEAGGHYICYFRRNGIYYYFNDMGPSIREIDKNIDPVFVLILYL